LPLTDTGFTGYSGIDNNTINLFLTSLISKSGINDGKEENSFS